MASDQLPRRLLGGNLRRYAPSLPAQQASDKTEFTERTIHNSLLYDFVEILMWCFAPGLAVQVAERQKADRTLRSVVVQTEVYGVPLWQIKQALAQRWHLPQLLITLMDPQHAEHPRVRNVKLAVDLARHSANGWDDAALPDDYKAIEELLHISHETLMHKLGLDLPHPDEDKPATNG